MKYEYITPGEGKTQIEIPDYTNVARDKINYEKRDVLLAFGMLLCGFLYMHFIDISAPGAGTVLFSSVICIMTAVYLKATGFNQNKNSIAGLAVIIILNLNCLLFDNDMLKPYAFILLSFAYVYWVAGTTLRLTEKGITPYSLADIVNQIVLVPFSNFFCEIGAFKNGSGKIGAGKTIIMVIVGLLVAVPIVFVVGNLLADADTAFGYIMYQIYANLSLPEVFPYLVEVLLGIPVAMYLYGLVFGDANNCIKGCMTAGSIDKMAISLRIIPGALVYTVLIVVNLLYAIFVFAQTTYLFSAFEGILPVQTTYAEYARNGFFQLCTVAVINAVIMIATNIFVKRAERKQTGIRTLTGILAVSTMLIIVTALSKMMMYINSYGLTQLRVYTSLVMLGMFLAFAVILIRQCIRFNATGVIIVALLVAFMAVSFVNVDGQIAKYNIDRYEAGTLRELDTDALMLLSDGAVTYLYDEYKSTEDSALKARLWYAITQKSSFEQKTPAVYIDFDAMNLQSWRAQQIRETVSRDNPEKFAMHDVL